MLTNFKGFGVLQPDGHCCLQSCYSVPASVCLRQQDHLGFLVTHEGIISFKINNR